MTGIFVHKSLINGLFSSWFNYKEYGYRTRSSYQAELNVPLIRNRHSEQAIAYRGPKIWNAVREDIRGASMNTFKMRYKFSLINLD